MKPGTLNPQTPTHPNRKTLQAFQVFFEQGPAPDKNLLELNATPGNPYKPVYKTFLEPLAKNPKS